MTSGRILIDADACPVKAEVIRVAERFGAAVVMVSNGGIRPAREPFVEVVVVAEGPDAGALSLADPERGRLSLTPPAAVGAVARRTRRT